MGRMDTPRFHCVEGLYEDGSSFESTVTVFGLEGIGYGRSKKTANAEAANVLLLRRGYTQEKWRHRQWEQRGSEKSVGGLGGCSESQNGSAWSDIFGDGLQMDSDTERAGRIGQNENDSMSVDDGKIVPYKESDISHGILEKMEPSNESLDSGHDPAELSFSMIQAEVLPMTFDSFEEHIDAIFTLSSPLQLVEESGKFTKFSRNQGDGIGSVDCAKGIDVERNDGKMATVLKTRNAIDFLIWHDRFPNNLLENLL
eukprot:NP_508225.2 Uncharacterized protein CELE_T13G4.5 [Caenorhabditis elegans]